MKNILLLFILFTGLVSWGQDYDVYLNSFHSEGVGNKNISSFSFDIPDTVNSFKIDFNPYEVPDAIYIKYGEKEIWSGFITEFKDTNYYRVYSELVPGMLVGETVDVTDNSGLKVATLTRVLPGKYTFNGSKGYIIASEDRKDGRMKISNDFEEYFLKALQKEPKEYKVVAISKKTSKNNGSFLVRPEDENFNTPKNYVGELIQEKTNNGYLDFINSEINKIGGNPITSLFNGGDEELEKITNSIINGSKKYYGIEKTFGNVLEGQTSFILAGNKRNNKLQVIVFSTKKEEKKQFDGIITTCSSCIMKNDKNNGLQKEYYPFRGNSANFKDVKIIQTSIQSEKNEILALQKLIDKKTNLINDLNRIRLGYGVDFFTVKRKYIDGKLNGKKLDEFTDYILLKDDYDEILVQIKKQSLRLAQLKEELLKEASKPYYQPSLKESFTYVNGQKTGIHKEFDKNENLVVEEELKDGVRNGSFKRYENGIVKEEGPYLNNKKNGLWTIHSYNGKEEVTYSNDVKNGEYKKYNGDVVVSQGQYSNGLKTGEWKDYNNQSILTKDYIFNEDKLDGPYKEYAGDVVVKEGQYSNGLMTGEWIFRYDSGNLRGQGKYVNGDGGNLSESGFPKNGRDGLWKWYYENGEVKLTLNYKNGLSNGEYVRYHENGEVKEIGLKKDGKNEGEWISYHENGNKSQVSSYVNGKREGETISYHENGNKEWKYSYVNGKRDIKTLSTRYYENGNRYYEGYTDGEVWNGAVYEYREDGITLSKYEHYNSWNGELRFIIYYREDGKTKEKTEHYYSGVYDFTTYYDKYGNEIKENNSYSSSSGSNKPVNGTLDKIEFGTPCGNVYNYHVNCPHCDRLLKYETDCFDGDNDNCDEKTYNCDNCGGESYLKPCSLKGLSRGDDF